ncbi:MAG TPA: transglutaminase family protein [Verrucomicrobiae bacterium]|nr:transglutaminase family protein [Verrucomicrobiae bacterium]
MKFEIRHRTHYGYASPVRESRNELHLQPPVTAQQTVDWFLVKILPGTRLRHYRDFYSNCVHYFELPEPHSALTVESHLRVTTHPANGLPANARPGGVERLKEAMNSGRCYDFLQTSRFVENSAAFWRLGLDAAADERDVWQQALRLMAFVHSYISYQSHSTHVHTHPSEVLARRRGVCQDFAHVMLSLCRSLKIPALYVSGYLATETANATHAWVEVFIPGHGWQALDPTHNRTPDESYIKIAVGRDYADVAPLSGTYKGTTERTMEVTVHVDRIG